MIAIKRISPAATLPLRQKILWPSKPLSFSQIVEDDDGQHFGLFRDDAMLSVISLFTCPELKSAQFRKFATETTEQGKGFGSILLNHVIGEASSQGCKILWCNARVTAFPFYKRIGFEITSKNFEKEGVEYVQMSLILSSWPQS